ncbi:MptD family putative ECF transporter S component [[Eubacterium] hominis]|uniref:MptD family putative ECF transporter S component n=1 Tax=[Eubacterium] hominis TaxID=2764325 RepID=UPI0022DEC349
MKKTNKLQIKDLVTIGIYTAIYFMVNVIVMVCGGIAPLVWIFMPTILSLICGVIYMPLMAKVQKPGAILIMGMITALIYLIRGGFSLVLIVTYSVSCILAELIRKQMGYSSFKSTLFSYAFFSMGMVGDLLPIWMFRDQYAEHMLSSGMPADYIEVLNNVTSVGMLVMMLATTFLMAFVGGFLGKLVMKKHLEKAGIV